jgi:excisionase family DNA binding protein
MTLAELLSTDAAVIDLWPEAGRLLGMSRSSTYRCAANGSIPTVRLGRRRVVPVLALRRMLSAEEPSGLDSTD